MDKKVERKVASCLPCEAATDYHLWHPLKTNPAPAEPWDRVICDHWGPTPINGKHILVIIDGLTQCPEVLKVNGTGEEDNIHTFSEVFPNMGFLDVYSIFQNQGTPFSSCLTDATRRLDLPGIASACLALCCLARQDKPRPMLMANGHIWSPEQLPLADPEQICNIVYGLCWTQMLLKHLYMFLLIRHHNSESATSLPDFMPVESQAECWSH